jgi:AraC-like DNA-binding protein
MDVLADLLTSSGVRGVLGARIAAGRDWGWWAQGSPAAALHAVTAGRAWLREPGREPIALEPGDVLLLPRGGDHALASDRAAALRTTVDHHDGYDLLADGRVRIGGGGTRTHILCAHYRYAPGVPHQLMTALPETLHVRASQGGEAVRHTVRLLEGEMAEAGPASTVVLDRLVDVLLVQLLRAWMASAQATLPRNLAALADPVAGPALAALHAEPARDWTTAALAHELSVSRATLHRRFVAAVGEPPMAYLARWRMDLAAVRLRDGAEPVQAIAAGVGYGSQPAFNRAFRRAHGTPPGRYRAAVRAA